MVVNTAETVAAGPLTKEFNRRSIGAAIACWVAILFGPGPMLAAGTGMLTAAVAADYGWSRTTFSMVPILSSSMVLIFAPIFGRWMDRFGLRKVLIPGIAAFGVSFLILSATPPLAWVFFAACVPVGIAAASQGVVGYNKLIGQWFTRKRGMMLGLVAAGGSGLGYMLAPQILNRLIENFGWRSGYFATGVGILCICLPTALLLLRERDLPTARTVSSSGGVDHAEGVTHKEGLGDRNLWALVALLFLAANAYFAVLFHLFPFLTDRGLSRGEATNVISSVAIGAVSGQLFASFILDRVNTPKVALLFFSMGLTGILLLHHVPNGPLLNLGAAAIGFGQGAELSVLGYIVSRIFGLRAFGSLYGMMYAGASFAAGTGPLLMGILFDRTGSYSASLVVWELVLCVSLVLVLTLRPYAYGRARS